MNIIYKYNICLMLNLHVLQSSYCFAYEREVNISCYYMAVSHEDWELPNSRIWLAKIDIDRGLDFPM